MATSNPDGALSSVLRSFSEMGTLRGGLLAESLRIGAVLDDIPLVVRRIWRIAPEELGPGQPERWTLIEFESDETHAAKLADWLSAALDDSPPWYCDFQTTRETFVVFPGRIFRYGHDEPGRRKEAEEYALSIYPGLPASQLDWPEPMAWHQDENTALPD